MINEVRLLDRLDHENIIDFHGSWVNRDRGEVCFITEILSSGSLKRFIQRVQVEVEDHQAVDAADSESSRVLALEGPQDHPPRHQVRQHLHQRRFRGFEVGDLGLSTARAADDAASKGRSVLGTPEFMAPELYDEAYDEKVDVYAFGMCALEMITKQLPYAECRNATQIYKKVQADVPPDALALVPDERAAAFVRLCVRRDPAARPSASNSSRTRSWCPTRPSARPRSSCSRRPGRSRARRRARGRVGRAVFGLGGLRGPQQPRPRSGRRQDGAAAAAAAAAPLRTAPRRRRRLIGPSRRSRSPRRPRSTRPRGPRRRGRRTTRRPTTTRSSPTCRRARRR